MNGNTSLPAEILKCWNVGDDPNQPNMPVSQAMTLTAEQEFRDNSDVSPKGRLSLYS